MTWKDTLEIVSTIAGAISSIGAVVAAGFAAFVYYRNSAFERAKWASSLYEKFYGETTLKQLRDRLDCVRDSDSVNEIVIREESAFTDYLNFFEFIAFLKSSKQLKDSEIEALFGYYLDCLNRHDRVKQYVANPENGYEGLAKLLISRL
jgi:hypothetical protein